jgi:hypothetical protein
MARDKKYQIKIDKNNKRHHLTPLKEINEAPEQAHHVCVLSRLSGG